jgi:NADPH:quinone reductase-like Zn-dependent oxidoreductase
MRRMMLAVQVAPPYGRDSLSSAGVPDPVPGPGDVLVRFEASSINPADLKIRDGLIRPRAGSAPFTLGWDLIGTVESGDGFAIGTRVVGMSAMASTGRGTWSELVAMKAASLAAAPDCDPAVIAQLPLVGLTALQAVQDLDPSPGDDVVVLGAAGSVGSLVVQLLLARGLRPRAVVRDAEIEQPALAGLGVEISDSAAPQSADGIVDCAGIGSSEGLRGGGRFVVVVPGTGPTVLPPGAAYVVVRVEESGERLRQLISLFRSGVIRLGDPERFPLPEALAAFDAFERRSGRRVVLLGGELADALGAVGGEA